MGILVPILSSVLSGDDSGSSTGTVAPFAYEAEAETFFAAAVTAGVTPTTNRKLTYNRVIKRLKGYGVWSKLSHLWLLAGSAEAITFINVKNPGTNDLVKNGSPTFLADNYWQGTAANNTTFLDTGVALNEINPTNHSMGVFCPTTNATGTGGTVYVEMGAFNGTFVMGIKIRDSVDGLYKIGSASSSVSASSNVQTYGLHCISRNESGSFYVNRRGFSLPVLTATAGTTSSTTTITILKRNGDAGGSTNKLSAAFLGTSLTEWDMRMLYAVLGDYTESLAYGEFYEESAGTGIDIISADVVVYGTTSGAVCAAYEAARAGKSVVMIGGWRDRQVGGMAASGLGFTDFENHASIGGLPRWFITEINALYSRADTTFTYESRQFYRVCQKLLDPAKNGGFNIPVYYTRGVKIVTKDGTEITGFKTVDGRTVAGLTFIDCSYEGDLAKASGVTMTKGREAAGSGTEALNGFRGIRTTDGGSNHQMSDGTVRNIDPYVIPGNSSSGLLNGISRTYGVDTPALNSADDEIQAYNFRMTLTTNSWWGIPFPTTPPSGYNQADWEPLARLMDAYPATVSLGDIMYLNPTLGTDCLDINTRNGWSTDFLGGSKAYPAAPYATREAIWKAHWNRIMGLFYFLQYDPTARVTTAVRNEALTYYFHSLHYFRHHENDEPFMNPNLYVREAWRMVSDVVWNGNDITATDGTTPRSVKTISTASYTLDSHSTEALADPNGGTPRIWVSGNFEAPLSGNKTAPIPYEIIIPSASECTNLFVTFALSATHTAFGSIRMELSFMQTSQSAARAASLALDGGTSVQAVDYTALRTALLASPTLTGEVAPVLPQVN